MELSTFIEPGKSPFDPGQAQTDENVQISSEHETVGFSTGSALTTAASPDLDSNDIVTPSPNLATLNDTARTSAASSRRFDASKKPYLIAKGIWSTLKENGVKSDQVDIIEEFISKYDLTKDLVDWKKRVIVQHIRTMLENSEKENPSTKQSVNRRSTRRWSRFGSRRSFDGRRTRSVTNGTSEFSGILDAMKNFTNVISEVRIGGQYPGHFLYHLIFVWTEKR